MAVLHVAHDDQLVHQSLQVIPDHRCRYRLLSHVAQSDSSVLVHCAVIPHRLNPLADGLLLVVVELQHRRSFLSVTFVAVARRIDIPHHRLVRRQDHAVF